MNIILHQLKLMIKTVIILNSIGTFIFIGLKKKKSIPMYLISYRIHFMNSRSRYHKEIHYRKLYCR